MSDVPSADLLARFRRDDPGAADELHRRYAERLVRLARSRLSSALAARLDAEDVALSAWRSFFVLARGDGIVLQHSGDLWRLLARITVRKVCANDRRQRAARRNVGREQPLDDSDALARGPTPAGVAALADELRCVLAPLDPVRRRVAELRLQGHDADEIAAQVGRSSRTVRRVLAWLGDELQRRLIDEPARPEDGAPLIDYGEIVLRRQVGQGGMGKVYLATWRGETVAVQLLPKPLRGHAPLAARFLEEAAMLGRLRHPGIVAVRGVGRLPDDGRFLVMDFVEGGDLQRLLDAGPVPLADALTWTAQVADAVAHAHAQGVVHCDLKPSNVLLDRAGLVRVTDFGLARAIADHAAGGTAGFMAPEQRSADGVVSARTGVHGLGALLVALLSGRAPFAADGSLALPPLPADVEALCRRCLEPDPARRPASAHEVAEALRAVSRPIE